MTPDEKGKGLNRIPIRFFDSENDGETLNKQAGALAADGSAEDYADTENSPVMIDDKAENDSADFEPDFETFSEPPGGPDVAELVAARAELKRVENENIELKDKLARRQADFENYRKRIERERQGTHDRVVADIAAKLLPVLDNLKRALDTEASVEAGESDEFRHFLSGVDLIYKQLNGVLDSLGVKSIPAVGEKFDPHLHEAVISEATDEYEPDTVMHEIVPGYRLGDKLIRPSLVKVATKK